MGFYYIKIYNARPQTSGAAVGVKGNERAGTAQFEFTTSDVATTTEAAIEMLGAFTESPLFSKASPDTLNLGQGIALPADATSGAWSKRVGKGVYAYSIGYDELDAADAKAAAVDKNLA